jgi:hypothetical protein
LGRADSPLKNRIIFCFGSRRSGTFLLHRIVAAHPDVSAVPSETHLFSHGISPLMERFHHGARSSTEVGTMYADRDLLLDATREFCDRVFAEFIEPGRPRLVERTPLHALHSELIAEIYPDASFVQIIRDGRDVARSLVGQEWGPSSVESAAREWREAVAAGRRISGREHYVELRYEDLLESPRPTLERLYGELRLDAGETAMAAGEAALAARENVGPGGGGVGTGKWRASWDDADLEAFERAAGETLRELGYPALPLEGDAGPRNRVARAIAPLREALPRRRAEHPVEGAVPVHTGRPEMLLNRLLTAISAGRLTDAVGLLTEDAEVRIETADAIREGRGEAAGSELEAALAADPALRGRQVDALILPGEPTAVGSFRFELPGGGRAERLVAIRSDGERIASLIISRLPVGH